MREPAEREPLHNFEAEQAVLGTILADNAAWHHFSDFLTAEAFTDGLHRKMFTTICRVIERGQVASPVTLRGYFESDADLRAAGGLSYVASLAAVAVPAADAAKMAQIIYDLQLRRQAIDAMRETMDAAHELDAALDPAAFIGAAADRLGDIAGKGLDGTAARPFSAVVDDVLGTAETVYNRGGGLSGISTGLASLDAMLGGLHPADLTILAGRPSMGKTALATDIGCNVARDGLPVGFFSLEMSAEQIGARIVSAAAGVPGHKMRQGTMSAAEIGRYMAAGDAVKALPLFVDDTAALSISALRSRARRMHRQHGIRLLIVDYLQLCSGGDRRDGRTAEVSEITRGLKALAKELSVPVLALSQLSRAVEQRTDKRPQLSDLRESGSIEQDADAVLFVYRGEYYLERSDKRGSPDHIASMGQAELIVAKQRHGPTGTALLRFDGALTKFSDASGSDAERQAA